MIQMIKKKTILILIVVCLFSSAFAVPPTDLASTPELFICIPQMMNNVGKKLDLSMASSFSSDSDGVIYNCGTEVTSTGENCAFRIYSTIHNRYHGYSSGKDHGYPSYELNYSLGDANKTFKITLSPHYENGETNGWNFVHETNWTSRCSFDLAVATYYSAIDVEVKQNGGAGHYDNTSYTDLDLATKNMSQITTVNNGSKSHYITPKPATIVKTGDNYEITFYGTPYYAMTEKKGNINTTQWAAELLTYLDVYVKLRQEDINGSIEPGIYSAAFDISAEFDSGETDSSKTHTKFEDTVYLYGYYGYGESGNQISSNFLIMPTACTNSMDLSNTSTSYEIANLHFGVTQTGVKTDPTTDGTTIKDEWKNKYTIYISPTPVYTNAGEYAFVKVGTENQTRVHGTNTIGYSISLGSGYGSEFENYDSSSASKIGSVGKGTGSPIPASTLYIRPVCTQTQLAKVQSSSGSGSSTNSGVNTWVVSWNTENLPLYLSVSSDDVYETVNGQTRVKSTLRRGIYYSYLYFTVVED